jgi:hypothetical protein
MLRAMTPTVARAVLAVLFAVCAVACGGETPPYVVIFRAYDEQAKPMPGVTVEVNALAAQTAADGSVTFQLRGTEGQRYQIKVLCPAGYRVASDQDTVDVTLRRVYDSTGEGFMASERNVRCVPTRRRVAMVIMAGEGGANLPVLVDEQEQTKTDAAGVAHFALAAPPSSSFRVKIDSPSGDDPARTFRVPDVDEVFLFEQEVQGATKPKAEPAPRKRRRAKKPSGGGPRRL